MRILWIFFVLGIFTSVSAASHHNRVPPPAEMIMMGGFDDEDVESVEDFTTESKPVSNRDKKSQETTDLFIIPSKKPAEFEESVESIDQYQNEIDEYQSESVDLSQYSNISNGKIKIALLVPKKVIGAYADSVSNSIISYLLFKDSYFQFEVFDSKDEQDSSIVQKLGEIRAKGYQIVIAPLTKRGADIVIQSTHDLLLFIPTINKNEISNAGGNIIFGGIDYRKQIDALLSFANEKIVLFNDGSSRSKELSDYIKEQAYDSIVYEKDIKKIKTNIASIIKNNKKLKKASIFLNMPIVKSSLLASQLTQNKVEPHVLLSTQANYNPLIFKLTQYKDREFFYIANSIAFSNNKLKEINIILGNKPDFSWIDYSTAIGMDHIFSSYLAQERVFQEDIYENQIEYKVRVEKAGISSFEPVGGFSY